MSNCNTRKYRHFRNFRGKEKNSDVDISKKLAYILRYGAYDMDLDVDNAGYVYVMDILNLSKFRNVRERDVIRIVQNDDKDRFHLQYNEGNLMIRATKWYTLKNVDSLDLCPIVNAKKHPCIVYGTTYGAWENIKDSGLKTMGQTHIRFASGEPDDCRRVVNGMRKNSQVLIYINLEKALKSGITFFLSTDGVILSRGNENGVISPVFFKNVLDRKTRKWPVEKERKKDFKSW